MVPASRATVERSTDRFAPVSWKAAQKTTTEQNMNREKLQKIFIAALFLVTLHFVLLLYKMKSNNQHEVLTIVIPTVNRINPTLPKTLRSLFYEARTNNNPVKVILVNGELQPSEHTSMAQVMHEYAIELESGQLQVVNMMKNHNVFDPESEKSEVEWMSDMLRDDKLRVFHDDTMDRIKWRSKEVLDFVKSIKVVCGIGTNETLKSSCKNHAIDDETVSLSSSCNMTKAPHSFLFLEDDTTATSNVFNKLTQWLRRMRDPSWFIVSLYSPYNVRDQQEYYLPCCSQAILFKCKDMSELAQYLISRYDEDPIDWLLSAYAKKEMMERGRRSYVAVPNLFQHMAAVSTFAAKRVSDHMSPTFVP